MNIYKVYRTDDIGYDAFDGFVCVAHDEEEAKSLQPENEPKEGNLDYKQWRYPGWVKDTVNLKVDYLGAADDSFDSPKVILSSYNAA